MTEFSSKGRESKIDPATADVADRPRKPNRRDRIKVPDDLREWEAGAEKRLKGRPYPPLVMREPVGFDHEDWTPNHEDESLWALQLADAFGTRSSAVINCFLVQLEGLCPGRWWDEEAQQWRMDEWEFNTVLTLVSAAKPRNELEAALAAQMVAVHMMTMKLSERAIRYSGDIRTANVASKLARTFAQQMETMRLMRTGKRTARQSIKVTKELHQHVHYHRGEQENGLQSHAAEAVGAGKCAAVPSSDEGGQVVPLPRRSR